MTKKLTYQYTFTLLKMKKAEGRNEYMDLAKEANLLWHQILSQKSKNTPRITAIVPAHFKYVIFFVSVFINSI